MASLDFLIPNLSSIEQFFASQSPKAEEEKDLEQHGSSKNRSGYKFDAAGRGHVSLLGVQHV
jgi:hypothetical protein